MHVSEAYGLLLLRWRIEYPGADQPFRRVKAIHLNRAGRPGAADWRILLNQMCSVLFRWCDHTHPKLCLSAPPASSTSAPFNTENTVSP